MSYTVKIPEDSIQTLVWLSDRGYDGKFYELATVRAEPSETEDGCFIFEMSELSAWEFNEYVNEDTDAFLACCGDPDLSSALIGLLNSIV